MIPSSLGDLAQAALLRRESGRLTAEIGRLTAELSSGRTQDLVTATGGATAPLAEIDRGLARLEAYRTAVAEQRLETEAAGAAIDRVRSGLEPVRDALLVLHSGTDHGSVDRAVADARQAFDATVATLNATANGRSLFAGTAADSPALAPAGDILAAVEAAVLLAGVTDPVDIAAEVEAFFAVGGGFDTVGYLGSATSRGPVALTDEVTSDVLPRADADEVRETLAALATGALAASPALGLAPADRSALARVAGERVLSAEGALVQVRAAIGNAEGDLEAAGVALSTEEDLLTKARSDIVSADPFEVATALQAAEARLAALYTITARQARLSLANFL